MHALFKISTRMNFNVFSCRSSRTFVNINCSRKSYYVDDYRFWEIAFLSFAAAFLTVVIEFHMCFIVTHFVTEMNEPLINVKIVKQGP